VSAEIVPLTRNYGDDGIAVITSGCEPENVSSTLARLPLNVARISRKDLPCVGNIR
jgi:hypothetical protein